MSTHDYRIDDVVWARLGGLPYWPGRIIFPELVHLDALHFSELPSNQYLVQFFNRYMLFTADVAQNIFPFHDPDRLNEMRKSKNVGLLDAFNEAEAYLISKQSMRPAFETMALRSSQKFHVGNLDAFATNNRKITPCASVPPSTTTNTPMSKPERKTLAKLRIRKPRSKKKKDTSGKRNNNCSPSPVIFKGNASQNQQYQRVTNRQSSDYVSSAMLDDDEHFTSLHITPQPKKVCSTQEQSVYPYPSDNQSNPMVFNTLPEQNNLNFGQSTIQNPFSGQPHPQTKLQPGPQVGPNTPVAQKKISEMPKLNDFMQAEKNLATLHKKKIIQIIKEGGPIQSDLINLISGNEDCEVQGDSPRPTETSKHGKNDGASCKQDPKQECITGTPTIENPTNRSEGKGASRYSLRKRKRQGSSGEEINESLTQKEGARTTLSCMEEDHDAPLASVPEVDRQNSNEGHPQASVPELERQNSNEGLLPKQVEAQGGDDLQMEGNEEGNDGTDMGRKNGEDIVESDSQDEVRIESEVLPQQPSSPAHGKEKLGTVCTDAIEKGKTLIELICKQQSFLERGKEGSTGLMSEIMRESNIECLRILGKHMVALADGLALDCKVIAKIRWNGEKEKENGSQVRGDKYIGVMTADNALSELYEGREAGNEKNTIDRNGAGPRNEDKDPLVEGVPSIDGRMKEARSILCSKCCHGVSQERNHLGYTEKVIPGTGVKMVMNTLNRVSVDFLDDDKDKREDEGGGVTVQMQGDGKDLHLHFVPK